MTELLNKLLPILFLILIGVGTRKTGILTDQVIIGLKNIIVKITLPLILFKSFGEMAMQASYVVLFVLTFLYCAVLYIIGDGLHKWLPKTFARRTSGGFFTGFEFGMIGVGLFGAIWGIENLPVIMLLGFGHELFIWFVYVPLITMKNEGAFSLGATVKSFLKSPTIIGIVVGVSANLLNIYDAFGATLIGGAVYGTIDFLIPLTAPLILMVIGYSLSFKKMDYKEAAIYIVGRWVLVLVIGVPFLMVIQWLVPNLDSLFVTAFFAFILLPAPYVLPLFIKEAKESEFFSQLLVYSTVTSFIGYVVLMALTL